jgi:hypothetical protein
MVIKEIKECLSNRRGNIFIYLIIAILIIVSMSALVLDFSNLYIKSKKIKSAINRAVNASTYQILEGEELASGDFKIDAAEAQEIFEDILAKNLGLNTDTLEPTAKSLLVSPPTIMEFEVENDTPTTYNSPTLGMAYQIDNPSVVVVLDFEIEGIFINRTIRVAKLSSSQLTTVYD